MRWINSLTIMFAILLLAACGPRRAEVEPPRPTITPVPTFTLTPVGAAGAVSSGQVSQPAQVQPAATTAPPTATPTPRPMANVGTLMNVRAGPGTNYGIIGTASPGQQFPITGKNPGLGDWWEIEYTEALRGWVYSPLVNATNAGSVALALVIPAPPPPTATPIPAPTPVPAPTQPPAPQYAYRIQHQGSCIRHDRVTFFNGFIRDKQDKLKNDVCVHLHSVAVSDTKCSGCPSESGSHGRWEFAPFGESQKGSSHHDKVTGIYVEIYVVACPGELHPGNRSPKKFTSKDFSNLTPLSEKWTITLPQSQECKDITFREN